MVKLESRERTEEELERLRIINNRIEPPHRFDPALVTNLPRPLASATGGLGIVRKKDPEELRRERELHRSLDSFGKQSEQTQVNQYDYVEENTIIVRNDIIRENHQRNAARFKSEPSDFKISFEMAELLVYEKYNFNVTTQRLKIDEYKDKAIAKKIFYMILN